MNKLNKKIYYQYVDLYRMATFNKDKGKAEHALRIMQLIQHTEKDIISSNCFELLKLGFTSEDFAEIAEFQQQKKIQETIRTTATRYPEAQCSVSADKCRRV